ncbi:hypothetical protein IQ250_12495 [Pseudanabaenaceae cyanobacterium LEGE 13415]|nr:hypothetical protein [Pseudanabaenaceae cyanobacterium LEGE 13415]
MSNLTKHDPVKWQAQKPQDYPVYRHNGTDYRLIPDSAFNKLLSDAANKDGMFWISIGIGCTLVAALTHIVFNAASPAATASQPIIIEKPVVVDREKVVPTNCIAFCGK